MRVIVQEYKKSIYDIGLDKDSEAIIWDFYVTKAMCKSASQGRRVSDYGRKNIPYEEMLTTADISSDNAVVLLANTMHDTLQKLDLETAHESGKSERRLEIETEPCRFAILTPFTISDNEKPKEKCGRGESLLTHIRNSFAHGNTYFFEDKRVMLEDKDQRGNITARIIIKVNTLFDWIHLIDKDEKYYHIFGLEEKENVSLNS